MEGNWRDLAQSEGRKDVPPKDKCEEDKSEKEGGDRSEKEGGDRSEKDVPDKDKQEGGAKDEKGDEQTDFPKSKLFRTDTEYSPINLPKLMVAMIPLGWRELFNNYERELSTVGVVLKRKIMDEKRIVCPSPVNVYRSLILTPWWNVKVVIIGQDPYYQVEDGVPSATGCCFECREGDPIRQSLRNIFTVLTKTVKGFTMPKSGDLTKWAVQGVLLLNASLTTEKGKPNEHKDIWPFFALRILQFLSIKKSNVVYMLWGRDAQCHKNAIAAGKNFILMASHPVAYTNSNTFLNCDHFNEANQCLTSSGQTPIDWRL
jgi:uracil-DNA glycosylase